MLCMGAREEQGEAAAAAAQQDQETCRTPAKAGCHQAQRQPQSQRRETTAQWYTRSHCASHQGSQRSGPARAAQWRVAPRRVVFEVGPAAGVR